VGAENFASIITAMVNNIRRENFGEHLKILIYIAVIYYITEFKHPEISIFRNTAVTNIRKYQTYVIQVCTIKFRNKRCPLNMR
jgi:hypothetical protein